MVGKRNARGVCESEIWLIAPALCDDAEGGFGKENPSTETTAEQAKTAVNTWTGMEILMVNDWCCCSFLVAEK
jgi:hypothetical protein